MDLYLCNRTAGREVGCRIPIEQLAKAMYAVMESINGDSKSPLESIHAADGSDAGAYPVDFDAFRRDVQMMDEMCQEAQEKMGKMVVRFLGDLKEQSYPLDTVLFNATKDDSHDLDLRAVIRNALLNSGGKEIRMVNLANVRDIRITPGNTNPALPDKIKYINEMISVFQCWIEQGDEIFVEKVD
jgi:hypothetical protein